MVGSRCFKNILVLEHWNTCTCADPSVLLENTWLRYMNLFQNCQFFLSARLTKVTPSRESCRSTPISRYKLNCVSSLPLRSMSLRIKNINHSSTMLKYQTMGESSGSQHILSGASRYWLSCDVHQKSHRLMMPWCLPVSSQLTIIAIVPADPYTTSTCPSILLEKTVTVSSGFRGVFLRLFRRTFPTTGHSTDWFHSSLRSLWRFWNTGTLKQLS